MLSNTSKYAIRSVIYLSLFSSDTKKVGLKEIARNLELPAPFLGKILQILARHGILSSTKGPNGGFSLGKSAQEITPMEIVEIIDGEKVFDICLIRTTSCSHDIPCSIHDKVSPARKEIKTLFLSLTIADLASEFRQDKERIRI